MLAPEMTECFRNKCRGTRHSNNAKAVLKTYCQLDDDNKHFRSKVELKKHGV